MNSSTRRRIVSRVSLLSICYLVTKGILRFVFGSLQCTLVPSGVPENSRMIEKHVFETERMTERTARVLGRELHALKGSEETLKTQRRERIQKSE